MKFLKRAWDLVPEWGQLLSYIALAILAFAAFMVSFGFILQQLWNYLMPGMFGLKEISLGQGAALLLLARLLVGGQMLDIKYSGSKNKKKPKEGEKTDEPDMKKDLRTWEHYDQWWEEEGKKSFEEYAERMSRAPEKDPGNDAG